MGADCGRLTRVEADYNRLFNLSLDLLCIAGFDGYFKRVNPSWTRVLGWSEEELLGRPTAEFVHPDDRERTLEARAGLAQGIPVRGLENRYRCKDGSYRWFSWESVAEPSTPTVFGVARDITERRQLDQERLVLSKLESTGVLAGGIAHDFNNLLAGLLLNLELVSLCGPTNPQQDQYLAQARQTIHTAKSLTQQLITFAGESLPTRRITDLSTLLRESLELALRGSSLTGVCEIAPDLWLAEIDEGQIGQVLRNLILNAREASPPAGTVRLRASNASVKTPLRSECAPGDYLCISVADEGVGIAPEVLPKIFDPYFSTKQRGAQKGMGLGLTICRTVVHKHGGMIEVESQTGGGTTVTFHLPARRRADGASPASVSVAEVTNRPRVLVMEDEDAFRELMGHTLQRLGYAVEQTRHGDEAVARYREAQRCGRPFALVLLDLTVRGGMGGSETLNVLRQHDPAVRAVLMTGHSNDAAFSGYAEYGFKGALSKPFSSESLRALLAEVLDG